MFWVNCNWCDHYKNIQVHLITYVVLPETKVVQIPRKKHI
jgi:hypothetical protein